MESNAKQLENKQVIVTDIDALIAHIKGLEAEKAELWNRQLFSSTRQWLNKSRFPEILKSLLAAGYTCIITTDHGNLEAQGNGQLRPNDKVGVSSRSKRHINFANPVLMDRFKSQQDMNRFGESGLSLFLNDNTAFAPKNTTVVTHGGSHLWEVIIPFIKINHD